MAGDDDELALPWAAGVQVSQGHWSVVLPFGNGRTAREDARRYAAFINDIIRRENNGEPVRPVRLWKPGGNDSD